MTVCRKYTRVLTFENVCLHLCLQSINAAEAELDALESRMRFANSDLDLTLSIKQGQVEVEQAAVVSDYSDALVVERTLIEMHNTAIETRGNDKIGVLHEIKDFRKGIHGLQWDNQRLDLEEEDLLQRTKDLQLLRVTKGLQSLIKGGDSSKDASEAASLEKLLQYQVLGRWAAQGVWRRAWGVWRKVQCKLFGRRVPRNAPAVPGIKVSRQAWPNSSTNNKCISALARARTHTSYINRFVVYHHHSLLCVCMCVCMYTRATS